MQGQEILQLSNGLEIEIEIIDINNDGGNLQVLSAANDERGKIWFLATSTDFEFTSNYETGYFFLNFDGHEMRKIALPEDLRHNPEENINGLKYLKDNQLLLDAKNPDQNYIFNTVTESYRKAGHVQFAKRSPSGLAISKDSLSTPARIIYDTQDNLLYYGQTQNGKKVLRLEMAGGRITNLDTVLSFLPVIEAISGEDFSKEIWFSGRLGITKISIHQHNVRHVLEHVSCRGLINLPNGNILAGSDKFGPVEIDLSKVPIEVFQKAVGGFNRGFHYDPEGYLWGNGYGVVYKFAVDPFKILKAYDFINSWGITTMIPDGKLMFGDAVGRLFIFDPRDTIFRPFLNKDEENLFGGHRFFDLKPINSNEILAATSKGLFHLNISENKFSTIQSPEGEMVFCISDINRGEFFTGTRAGTISKYALQVNSMPRQIKSKNVGESIATITADGQRKLWLGTFDGVAICDSSLEEVKWTAKRNLINVECNKLSALYDSVHNNMIIGTISGLNIFDLNKEIEYDNSSSIYLSSLSYYDKDKSKIATKTSFENNETSVVLPATNKYLKVQFHLDHPIVNERSYAYRLNGDQDWNEIGPQYEITFPPFAAGKHKIEIIGRAGSKKQSINSIFINIRVKQIFYKSIYFYLLILAALGVYIWTWYRRVKSENTRLEKEVENRTEELRKDKKIIEDQAEKLRSLDKIKSRFFANISHELRTPLTLIMGPLKQIQKALNKQDSPVGNLQMAINNAETLKHRIDEILDLSKLENDQLKLALKPIDLVNFINVSLSNFHSMFATKGIHFSLENKLGDEWITNLDKRRFEKIIFNLIHNAIKFTPTDGRVKVTLEGHDGDIKINIADTGQGISKGDLDFIFDRYFQTNEITKKAEGGTGIGLALVKELTELMGGEISVESELGVGTVFRMQFPFQKSAVGSQQSSVGSQRFSVGSQQSEVGSQQSSVGSQQSTNSAKILVVEDHPDLRAHIISLIDQQYEVVEAENGLIAWQKLQSGQALPDLIISDVMMPEMDGFELLRKVKAIDSLKNLPFCFLTARADTSDKVAAYRLGIDDYLLKPFDEEELIARIENLLTNATNRKHVLEDSTPEEAAEAAEPEDNFILNIREITKTNLSNPQFGIDFLAEKAGYSSRSFYRNIQRETGLTPNAFVKEVRLIHARTLLENKEVKSLKELTEAVGLQHPQYFSKMYTARFGKAPMEYL